MFNDVVKDHLLRAFCFVYLINSHNSGGVQQDRVSLIECAPNIVRTVSSLFKFFVINLPMILNNNVMKLRIIPTMKPEVGPP